MNTLLTFEWPMSNSVVERLGWMLLHSLWQFALVALLAEVAVRALRRSSSALRYGVLVFALAVSVSAPLATWLLMPSDDSAPGTNRVTLASEQNSSDANDPGTDAAEFARDARLEREGTINSLTPAPGALSDPSKNRSETLPHNAATSQLQPSWSERAKLYLQPWLAWIVIAWSLGVVFCSARPLLGWYTLRRLRRVGVSPAPKEVLATLSRVSKQLGLRGAVRLLQSTVARVPMVVGYFRPVILLPVGLVTNVPVAQLEAILAHELAHVRRHDFAVNLLQTLVETLFFYHPAVWWLSHQIRVEREHCCDDLVVNLLGNRMEYGRALVAIEQLRGRSTVFALGVHGGSLLSRIRRIVSLGTERVTDERSSSLSIGLMLLGVLCALSMTWCCAKRPASSTPADQSHPILAKLPNGDTVELVHLTTDSFSVPSQHKRVWWKGDGTLDDEANAQERDPEFINRAPLNARSVAVRATTAAEGPSLCLRTLPATETRHAVYFDNKDQQGKPVRTLSVSFGPVDSEQSTTLRVGVTDETWGDWQQISPTGELLNKIDESRPHWSSYQQIKVMSAGPRIHTLIPPEGTPVDSNHWVDSTVVLQWPSNHDELFAFEFRAVSTDGKTHMAIDVSYAIDVEPRTSTFHLNGDVFRDRLARFEYRLRPYRHWVTFENVSLQPGHTTDVKAIVEPVVQEIINDKQGKADPTAVDRWLTPYRNLRDEDVETFVLDKLRTPFHPDPSGGSWQDGAYEAQVLGSLSMVRQQDRVVQALIKVVDRTEQATLDQRRLAMFYLGGAAPQQIVPRLIKVLETEPFNSQERSGPYHEIAVLARIGVEAHDAAPVLIKLLDSPDGLAREEALLALVRVGPSSSEVINAIAQRFGQPDEQVWSRAVYEVGRYGELAKPLGPTFVKLLDSKTKEARIWAAQALVKSGYDEARGFDTLTGDVAAGRTEDRSLAASALAALGDQAKSMIPKLRAFESDPDASVAQQVREAIRRIETNDRIFTHAEEAAQTAVSRKAGAEASAALRAAAEPPNQRAAVPAAVRQDDSVLSLSVSEQGDGKDRRAIVVEFDDGRVLRLDEIAGQLEREKLAIRKKRGETAVSETTVRLKVNKSVRYEFVRDLIRFCQQAGFQKFSMRGLTDDDVGGPLHSADIRLVGGPKNESLANVTVEFTSGHGSGQRSFGTYTTDDTGSFQAMLPVGFYYLHLSSEKEWPYLHFENYWGENSQGQPQSLNMRVTEQGVEKWLGGERRERGFQAATTERPARITFNLEPAVELVLRAVDIKTGKGLAGVEFYEEVAAGEDWAHPVYGFNLGTKFDYGSKELTGPGNLTDQEGVLHRWVGEQGDQLKFGVWEKESSGYQLVEPQAEVAIITKLGQARVEQVFKFRRIRWAVRVEPEKKKIMLGEPLWLTFTVTNRTNETRGLELGGDYRNRLGRPETFQVTVINNHADKMPIPDAGMSMGGISSNVLLKPNGETEVKLFLSDWATILEPGHYRVFVKRDLHLFPIKARQGDQIEWGDTPETAAVEARCEFEVVAPNADQFGVLIDQLGNDLTANLVNGQFTQPPARDPDESFKMLASIRDERTVPFYLKLLRDSHFANKRRACDGLAPYASDAAFNGLKDALKTTADDISHTTTRALAESSAASVHQYAVYALTRSPHPSAADFALTLADHKSEAVRLTVLHHARKLAPKNAHAVQIIAQLTQDSSQLVRDEAIRYQQQLAEDVVK